MRAVCSNEAAVRVLALDSPRPIIQREPRSEPMTIDLPSADVDWEQPDDLHWDPFNHTLHENAFPTWKRMRDEAPLYYNEQYDFYALSRFEDCLNTYVDWGNYSSAQGDILEIIRGGQAAFTTSLMISEDPPLQRLHRSTINRAFTPKAVKTIEDRVRGFATRLLDQMQEVGRLDMVRDFGANVAGTAIGGMLGIPDEELPMVIALTDAQLANFQPDGSDDTTRWKEESNKKALYYLEQVNQRRARPTDDILSQLANMEFTDERGVTRNLDDAEAIGNAMLLTGGGYETMSRFTGWVGATLAQNPDERRKLVEHPELITNAVEELLRYQPPSHANARVSTKPSDWYGRTIPEGSTFLLIPGAAGRDERQFEDPDVFSVEREFERHLAFGFGVHYCLGAPLAKMEGRIIIEELLKRIPEWEVDWDNAEFAHAGSTARGYASLPIVF
jgi:cytochrome P450